jgi:hypothetical protein
MRQKWPADGLPHLNINKTIGTEILLIGLLSSSGGNFDLSEIIEVAEFFEDTEV